MSASLPIPNGPDELTADWLTAALREGDAITAPAQVGSFEAELMSEGVGFIGIVARLKLTYAGDADGAPRTMIAKFPSPDPGARQVGEMYGLYEREVRFYRDLGDSVGVRAPRCYYAAMQPGEGKYVLFLEDLAAHGRLGDQVAGCSFDEAALAIGELAKLHGTWWQSPRLDEIPWLRRGSELVRAPMQQVYPLVSAVCLERYGGEMTEAIRAAVPTLGEKVVRWLDEVDASAPMTLTHGDYRLDNMFFPMARSGELAIIDWQSPNIGWGTYDLAYFIAGSMPPEQRRRCERELLARYHALIEQHGARGYSLDQLSADYRMSMMAYLAMFVINGATLDASNPRAAQLFEVIFGRLVAAITDLDAVSLLPA